MTLHPITPPPELVQQWYQEADNQLGPYYDYIATQAARWGSDQELEACCEWLHWQNLATHQDLIPSLRAARRPQPPSLKEQALEALDEERAEMSIANYKTIRAVLEQLDD